MTPIEMLEDIREVISIQYELLRKEMNIKQLQNLIIELEQEVITEEEKIK